MVQLRNYYYYYHHHHHHFHHRYRQHRRRNYVPRGLGEPVGEPVGGPLSSRSRGSCELQNSAEQLHACYVHCMLKLIHELQLPRGSALRAYGARSETSCSAGKGNTISPFPAKSTPSASPVSAFRYPATFAPWSRCSRTIDHYRRYCAAIKHCNTWLGHREFLDLIYV